MLSLRSFWLVTWGSSGGGCLRDSCALRLLRHGFLEDAADGFVDVFVDEAGADGSSEVEVVGVLFAGSGSHDLVDDFVLDLG